MRKILIFLIIFLAADGCRQGVNSKMGKIISVSIPPFEYFVKEIAGEKFKVNVMVPPGSDPHIYEPSPEQVSKLSRSTAYISNGYLGLESVWLNRFFEVNKEMKKLSLGESIEPLEPVHINSNHIHELADPHYWVSPKNAIIITKVIARFLKETDPDNGAFYEANSERLLEKITSLDRKATDLFNSTSRKSFMIFHPALGYLARDYGLEEIAIEEEGKEPSPARLKELIDKAHEGTFRTIFVQREFDVKYARVIAGEAGLEVKIIDPLSGNWYDATSDIINSLYETLK